MASEEEFRIFRGILLKILGPMLEIDLSPLVKR